MLQWLGVKPLHSRPRVSDYNVFAERLFRIAKHRTEFPAKAFASLDKTRPWTAEFGRWYNVDHRHSGIRYLSPSNVMPAGLCCRTDRRAAPWPGRRSTTRDGRARVLSPECQCCDQLLRMTLGGVQLPLMIDGSDQ